jgi:hypothetical protein
MLDERWIFTVFRYDVYQETQPCSIIGVHLFAEKNRAEKSQLAGWEEQFIFHCSFFFFSFFWNCNDFCFSIFRIQIWFSIVHRSIFIILVSIFVHGLAPTSIPSFFRIASHHMMFYVYTSLFIIHFVIFYCSSCIFHQFIFICIVHHCLYIYDYPFFIRYFHRLMQIAYCLS